MRHLLIRASLSFAIAGLPPAAAVAQSPGYDLLVSSRGTNAVKRYDGETGAYLGDFVTAGSGGLSVTQEVRLGPDGSLFVTGRGNSAVLRYDARTGAYLGTVTNGYALDNPTKTSLLADGNLYVSQWGTVKSTVAVFNATTGAFVREATPPLSQPMQHLLLPGGELLVVNFGSRDVRRFDAAGNALGSATTGRAFQGPVNLWRHESGDLLVMDWQAGTVERFDAATGAFAGTFISGFTTAEGWTIGPDGRLYIADWSQHVIRVFDRVTGQALGTFASGGGLMNPNSLLFIPRPPDYRVSAVSAAATVVGGQAATLRIVVAADRGTTFSDPVTLGCSGLPAGWSCAFAQSQAMPGATADTVTLSVQTAPLTTGSSMPLAWLLPAGACGLLATGLRRRAAPRLGWSAAAALCLVVACGGSTEPVPAPPDDVVGTITVRGTSGPLQRSTTVVVTATAE